MSRRVLNAFVAVGLATATGCNDSNDTPANCSSNSAWLDGDEGSPLMHPGGDCIGCHTDNGEGPPFTAAGTVMGAANDDTNCNGIAGATVELLDKNGTVAATMTTNAAGNFFTKSPIPSPFTAKVSLNGKTVEMTTPQTSGACASCHTAAGANGAPGRIAFSN
jgi:cytochrome c553